MICDIRSNKINKISSVTENDFKVGFGQLFMLIGSCAKICALGNLQEENARIVLRFARSLYRTDLWI